MTTRILIASFALLFTLLPSVQTTNAQIVGSNFLDDSLVDVNTTTADLTFRASTTPDLFGLAYDSNDGIVFGSSLDALYTLDINDGTTSLVGDLGFNAVGGLSFGSSASSLFGVSINGQNSDFLSVNRDTGNASFIASVAGRLDSLTYVPSLDRLFSVNIDQGTLVSIDPSNGSATSVGSVGTFNALAYDGNRNRIFGIDSFTDDLISINPLDASTTTIGPTGINSGNFAALGGLVNVTSVPEPSSLALALLAASVMATHRRKAA